MQNVDTMITKIKNYYPGIASQIVSVCDNGYFEILAKLDDGTSVSFYEADSSICIFNDMRTLEYMSWEREFAIRLRRRMYICGFTQARLADITNVSQAAISNYANGMRLPDVRTVDIIARALCCSVRYFTDSE